MPLFQTFTSKQLSNTKMLMVLHGLYVLQTLYFQYTLNKDIFYVLMSISYYKFRGLLYLAGTFGAIFTFSTPLSVSVFGCLLSCFLCLTYELMCVCVWRLHTIDSTGEVSVRLITKPVFT